MKAKSGDIHKIRRYRIFFDTYPPRIAPYCQFDPLQTGNVVYGWPLIGILMTLALKQINYKASIIGILMMLALKNINYKASIIGILIMLALNNIIMVVLNNIN